VIVSASLIIVLVSSLLSLRYQKEQLIASAQSSASALNNAIEANLQHAMLTGDRGMIGEIVRAIVAEGSVESLRILNDQGLVQASSVDGEVGIRFTQAEEVCQACHVNSTSRRSNNVVFASDNGPEVLLNVNLIQNKLECYTCHSPENQILGLMMIETSLSDMNEQLRTGFWRTALIAVTAFLLLIVLIVPALNRYIVQPIDVLSRGVAEISEGNLNYQVPVISHDELGKLAKSFDNMRRQLKITRAEMIHREQELAILNEVGLAATQLLDLQEIMEIALDTMVGKLGMDNVLIYLWDEAAERYTMQASRGISRVQIDEIERRRQSGYDITQEVVKSGKEEFVANMADDPRFKGVWQNLQNRSYVKLPLISRGTVVGVLGVVTPVGQSLNSHDVDFLKSIGREIGIAIDNATLLVETKQREKQAITLYRLGMKISAPLSLRDVLDAVAEAARELMNADIGLVGLMDDEVQAVIVKAVAGAQRNLTINMRMSVNKQAPWSELRAGQPYMTNEDDSSILNLHDNDLISREQIKSVLAVPLLRGGQFLGLVEVMTRKPRFFKQRDGRLLSRLANQVVVAVENAQLYRQLHHLVTLEERDRLARELHDHLAQGLAYLKVKASITEDLLSNAQIEQAQVSLLELKKASQVLYTDVREEIFNLRTAVKEQDGFFSVLRDYLIDYETHYDLEIHMIIEDDCPSEFSSEVASQLLRVIQEALTNVRRHSDAAKVLINCRQGGEQVCISIEDDGQGFYPDEVTKDGGQRYGLQIMRERAESVGGSLEIDSLPGKGTRVVVSVPPMYEEL
jgi:nitrate/nitrite-specific signal transduction histidine kinase